jgi:hypothetical protein
MRIEIVMKMIALLFLIYGPSLFYVTEEAAAQVALDSASCPTISGRYWCGDPNGSSVGGWWATWIRSTDPSGAVHYFVTETDTYYGSYSYDIIVDGNTHVWPKRELSDADILSNRTYMATCQTGSEIYVGAFKGLAVDETDDNQDDPWSKPSGKIRARSTYRQFPMDTLYPLEIKFEMTGTMTKVDSTVESIPGGLRNCQPANGE